VAATPADSIAPTGTLRTTTGCPGSYLGLSTLASRVAPDHPDDGPITVPDRTAVHRSGPLGGRTRGDGGRLRPG
jgi:hypothetical protein